MIIPINDDNMMIWWLYDDDMLTWLYANMMRMITMASNLGCGGSCQQVTIVCAGMFDGIMKWWYHFWW